MKKRTAFFTTVSLTLSLLSLHAASQDTVVSAAKKLAKAGGYSWKTTTEGSRFSSGPTLGKVAKDGLIHVAIPLRDNTIEVLKKDEKAAIKTQEGWQSLAEIEGNSEQQNRGRFMAFMVRNLKAPAAEAEDLAKKADGLSDAAGVYSGKLTEQGVKEMLTFRPRGGGEGPTVSNASGSVKFWMQNGMITKYEYSIKATMSWNGNDRDIERTTTVEISNLGSTNVEVPAAAKGKLS